jgi:hypothetical protein
VLRRFLREAEPGFLDLDVLVLSAKHGLISADKVIASYEEHITPERADQINAGVLRQLNSAFRSGYSEVFALVSKEYLRALRGYEQLLLPNLRWSIASVSEGRRLTVLRSWLYKGKDLPTRRTGPIRVTGHAVLKGIKITASPEDIMRLATDALREQDGSPYRFREWFVAITGTRVSTKWLVSLLSGLDNSKFQAVDARRVLARLGITVEHT